MSASQPGASYLEALREHYPLESDERRAERRTAIAVLERELAEKRKVRADYLALAGEVEREGHALEDRLHALRSLGR